ncbi:hypothetical protein GGS21DRAFT_531585 [Xylaria nigripes]|nr:hypothetical protein GGS21DRAFT_531585 [Xylaria nigripes]
MITREHTMYIALENHVDISSVRLWLPGEIANCPVGYIHDSELQRPQWGVRPVTNGTTHPFQRTVSDDTPYEILRPGVMICSQKPLENEHPAHFGTTSGILVQNHYGHQFMTVAAHEIRQSATIWQPTWSDDIVGRVVLEISSTDIALVKLSENVIFSNETFTNLGVEPPKFTRLLNSDDGINLKADCYLNSPYTGFTEGHIFMKSVRIEASDHPTEDRSRYIMYNWMYMGQAEGNDGWDYPPDGTSGSVIWDEDGVILGFHQYYINKGPWEGFSVSVSAGELVEAGYSLAATEA